MKNSVQSKHEVIIRPFTMKDMESAIACGYRFHKESLYSDIPMNKRKLWDLGEKAFKRDDHLFLVYERDSKIIGMFMANVTPYYFGDDYIAQDILWYIDPNDRGTPKIAYRTIKYYIVWAESWGCREAVIATSSGINIERTNEMLKKFGFGQVGTVNKMRF